VAVITFHDGKDPELCVTTSGGRILLRAPIKKPTLFAVTPARGGGGGGGDAQVLVAAVSGSAAGQPRQATFALLFAHAQQAVQVAAVFWAVNFQAHLPISGDGSKAAEGDAGGAALLLEAVQGDPEAFGRQLWGQEFEELVEAIERAWL
jgi:hypothetical protein